MLAYLLEGLMITYVPAEWIAGVVGGTGIGPILTGAAVGVPAYLNGYAAVPLIDGLLHQGMSQGAAMSFMIAGGVSSIPAAIAVWALVKPRVFAAYLGLAVIGAVMAGLVWGAAAGLIPWLPRRAGLPKPGQSPPWGSRRHDVPRLELHHDLFDPADSGCDHGTCLGQSGRAQLPRLRRHHPDQGLSRSATRISARTAMSIAR
jgi:hypothetical protein